MDAVVMDSFMLVAVLSAEDERDRLEDWAIWDLILSGLSIYAVYRTDKRSQNHKCRTLRAQNRETGLRLTGRLMNELDRCPTKGMCYKTYRS
jgi:hypothetical protein